jgi:hypothetical protein
MLPAAMVGRSRLLLAFAALGLVACAPQVGNSCDTALDCSAQGSRLCDRTQPGGYCTIRGCESGTCPDEAVCVKFRPGDERLSLTYCMRKCDGDGDCRRGDGYRCTSAARFGEAMSMDAVILGPESQRFCSIPALPPSMDANEEPAPDASMNPGADAASDP